MTQPAQVRNPFMLLISPEVVLAAIQNSAHLGKLNSTMCRPLDGPVSTSSADDGTDDSLEAESAVLSVS